MNSDQPERPLSTADMAGANEPDVRDREAPPGYEAGRGGEPVSSPMSGQRAAPLLPSEEGEGFRSRWDTIQATFVDEPRRAVEQADQLVAELMQRLAQIFSEEREQLERQWEQGDDVDTEELRVTLQHYRSFFDRLLSI